MTYFLGDSTIAMIGPYDANGGLTRGAVVGGSGAYAQARRQARIQPVDTTLVDFVFELQP